MGDLISPIILFNEAWPALNLPESRFELILIQEKTDGPRRSIRHRVG
jgi:hypothetical protein